MLENIKIKEKLLEEYMFKQAEKKKEEQKKKKEDAIEKLKRVELAEKNYRDEQKAAKKKIKDKLEETYKKSPLLNFQQEETETRIRRKANCHQGKSRADRKTKKRGC
jgi:hypothetical protein